MTERQFDALILLLLAFARYNLSTLSVFGGSKSGGGMDALDRAIADARRVLIDQKGLSQ